MFKGYKEELSVTVKQYKLPKFKVEVESPSYIWSGSDGVTLKLKATWVELVSFYLILVVSLTNFYIIVVHSEIGIFWKAFDGRAIKWKKQQLKIATSK